MNLFKAIGFKLISALLFAALSAFVRQLGDVIPVGQLVFFRSACAIPPVLLIYAYRGELASAVYTSRPLGQLGRGALGVGGMFTNFSALAGAVTLPLAWHTPTGSELLMLVSMGIFGGIGHIFLTESYRHATASVVAPFDYSSMLWALLLGYWVFGELPSALVYLGATIVAGAGLFVISRERQLGVRRAREAEGPRRPEI